ncbi:hypothetical protein RclHR1_03040007 [Rhizophagus clarus]|uniref:Uncharacterized protein n=1 Tax=Rhizophagus clarus TaxID=94130 RepID=A0A2Z6R6F9_9GLOM|nr:hypothetical protein RclHR1_03040007 [Rhizophagus clarus]
MLIYLITRILNNFYILIYTILNVNWATTLFILNNEESPSETSFMHLKRNRDLAHVTLWKRDFKDHNFTFIDLIKV